MDSQNAWPEVAGTRGVGHLLTKLVTGTLGVFGVALVFACGDRVVSSTARLEARLVPPRDTTAVHTVEVTGFPPELLSMLGNTELTADEWSAWFRVSVVVDDGDVWTHPSILGAYTVSGPVIRFTPMFEFDPGRAYRVRMDGNRLPSRVGDKTPVRPLAGIDLVVVRPAPARIPTTTIRAVYPTSATVPANLLRLYVEFSGPMSVLGGAKHVRLLDGDNQVVEDPFLTLDLALWNEDRTRYTLLFDPGRVKRGIMPNRELGPALIEGQTYTLAFDRGWRDEAGLPLEKEFTQQLTVGPPHHRAIDPTVWRISLPPVGTRDPFEVSLPSALDYGLLQRALRIVNAAGVGLTGEVAIEEAETVWAFTPSMAWSSEEHTLVALPSLEDPAGNRIGRAFEIATSDRLSQPAAYDGARVLFRPTIPR